MSLESEMREILVGDAGVSAVVGTRIYPFQREEDSALPAIVYRSTMENPQQSLRSEVDLSETIVEYECIAATIAAAKSLAELVRQALAGTSGAIGDIPHGAIRHTHSKSSFFDPFDGSAEGLFSEIVEFTVMYRTPSLA